MKKAITFIKKHPYSLIFALVTLFLMARIFSFSAEASEASNETSKGVCAFLAALFVKGFTNLSQAAQQAKIEELVPFIRKLAHFAIYAALGFFALLTQAAFLLELKRRAALLKCSALAAGFCLLYASTDEIHQLFVSGRSASALDVLLDFSGVLTGIIFASAAVTLFLIILKKIKTKRNYIK
ncbi:MAG: hypothetical protein E7539_06395 [Ruminococcaceae bacterium]|nr:hypothetical protein [Oscillospiraceae bacterium]